MNKENDVRHPLHSPVNDIIDKKGQINFVHMVIIFEDYYLFFKY